MKSFTRGTAALAAGLMLLTLLPTTSCVNARGPFGGPFGSFGGASLIDQEDTGDGGTDGGGGTPPSGGATTDDPCELSEALKVVRISMRNQDPDVYIHYFVAFVAFIHDPDAEVPSTGAVCPDDISFYRQNGYSIQIADGDQTTFGNYCINGPALIYFHESGRFRAAGGTGLASAIAPANGEVPTYDSFFTASGADIPVPNIILFHNPGTGEGAALKVSNNAVNPCDPDALGGTPNCQQDAFYYVSEDDRPIGSPQLGFGSFRRAPAEIQGTGCQQGLQDARQRLAPIGTTAAQASDNQFLRGGEIEYVFIRQDTDPPIPQLLWQVRDSRGAEAHDFDPRADL
jgi:hypothetical protein